MLTEKRFRQVLCIGVLLVGVSAVLAGQDTKTMLGATIIHNQSRKHIIISDRSRGLRLRLNYDHRCVIDQVVARGKEVISPTNGVYSGIKIAGTWYTTQHGLDMPRVTINGNTVTITDINFGPDNMKLTEKWNLTAHADRITLRIERTYHTDGTLEETHMPAWDFDSAETWTGALLGTGGVAWCKLIDTPSATYGVHDGKATFFNKENNACMRIAGVPDGNGHIATRFIHQPNDVFTASYCVSKSQRETKHHLRRFLANSKDLWKPFDVQAGQISSEYTLYGLDYAEEYDRGEIKYFDGNAIRDIMNTIARVGIVDTNLIGANTWRHCGFICIEEQWLVLMGLAMNDQDFFDAARKSMDYYRDHAVLPNGRVKPRWAYDGASCGPMKGTYDELGFHEMCWGYAMDSQAGYVGNVADLYDFNGDLEWVRTHKNACERALDYMLARDHDNDGLVEMMTDYHTDKKSSEVIDVIWASHENALVNAAMYLVLNQWADIEAQLGDTKSSQRYQDAARKLKTTFNKTTDDGGLWDPHNQWYVHWRDKDGSIHGNNLVTLGVNFAAIGYGICDDVDRQKAVLDEIEEQMQREDLFHWPICMYSYEKEEGHEMNFPFPKYVNGNIWLCGGEFGVRAYAEYDPAIAVKYIQKLIEQYKVDNLAHERYLRKTQTGLGADILGGNANTIVGLYRNIYGIVPKYNRLYLNPHLTTDLNGTRLNYRLRNQQYLIELSYADYAISLNGFRIRSTTDFAVSSFGRKVSYFCGSSATCSMSVTRSVDDAFKIDIDIWSTSPHGHKRWTEICDNVDSTAEHVIAGLEPESTYLVYVNGSLLKSVVTNTSGQLSFVYSGGYGCPQTFEIK